MGSSRSTIELYPHRMYSLLHHLKIIINQNFINLTGENILTSGQLKAADANCDGKVDLADGIAICKILAA